jgi:hypothetical protein
MPRKLPPYVERNHGKGHTYLSFRRGKGHRVRLPNDLSGTRWPLGTKQRTALHLFLNLGQRRSDVVRMAHTHITVERKIRIKQQKTGRELLIPFHRDTVEALDPYDMQHVVIITTAYGKYLTVDGFSGWMRGFSLERAKSIHFVIIAKRAMADTFPLSPASRNERPRGGQWAPGPIMMWRADRSTGSQKHRLKSRFSLAFSNVETG